ncbi:MAG: hypothetical protein P3X24_001735 [bacterium]|nr:hypothetical protein [bacterium]
MSRGATLAYRIRIIPEERWHPLVEWLAQQGLSLKAPTPQTPYAMVDGTGVGYATPFDAPFRRGTEIRRLRARVEAHPEVLRGRSRIEPVFGSVKSAYGSYVSSRSWRGTQVWVWRMLVLWNLVGLVQVGGAIGWFCVFLCGSPDFSNTLPNP